VSDDIVFGGYIDLGKEAALLHLVLVDTLVKNDPADQVLTVD